MILSALTLLVFSSCAVQQAGEDNPLQALIPDAGQDADNPISNTEYSDDIVFGIQRPDLKGDGNDPNTSDTTDGLEDDSQTQPAEDPTDDSDGDSDMEEYEGSNTEVPDEDDETGDDAVTEDDSNIEPDPDDVEIGENAEAIVLYDVPLSASKQAYVLEMAEEFDIPPELIFGVMYVESRYTETAIASNGKYIGIMQIAKSNLKTLTKKFGITDLQDYLQNVKAGAYFLSYFYKKYDGDIDKVLMCYHCGEGGASKLWRNGTTQDSYCRKVRGEMERILAAFEDVE